MALERALKNLEVEQSLPYKYLILR